MQTSTCEKVKRGRARARAREQLTISKHIVVGQVLKDLLVERVGFPAGAQVVDVLLELVHGPFGMGDAMLNVVGHLVLEGLLLVVAGWGLFPRRLHLGLSRRGAGLVVGHDVPPPNTPKKMGDGQKETQNQAQSESGQSGLVVGRVGVCKYPRD